MKAWTPGGLAADARAGPPRAVGLAVATAVLLAAALLALPWIAAGADPGIGEVERVEGRSVAKIPGGFVFVSTFGAMKGAEILGGYVEHTDGFYESMYAAEVWHGGALVKFVFGVECGQPVTVTFHVLYVPPGGDLGEYVRAITYFC